MHLFAVCRKYKFKIACLEFFFRCGASIKVTFDDLSKLTPNMSSLPCLLHLQLTHNHPYDSPAALQLLSPNMSSLPCLQHLQFTHNHPSGSVDSLQQREVSSATKEKFSSNFEDGENKKLVTCRQKCNKLSDME